MNELAHAIVEWDRSAFLAINPGMRSPVLDATMPHISDLGLGHIQVLMILAVAVAMAASRGEVRKPSDAWRALTDRRRWIVPLLLAFSISGLGAAIFKHTVPRDRPFWFYHNEQQEGRMLNVHVHTIEGIRPIRVRGFLSGHTATSVAIAMTLTLLYRKRRTAGPWLAFAWGTATLISFSRVYIADHWPIDVVGGALLGLLSAVVAVPMSGRWYGLPDAAEKVTQADTPSDDLPQTGTVTDGV